MPDTGYAEGDSAFNPQTNQEAVFTGGKWVVKGSPQMPLPQGDEPAMKDLQTNAAEAAWLAQKARQFRALQEGPDGSVQTGPMFKEFGIPHIAENINPLPAIANAIDPKHRVAQMESISNQAWTHMRPVGSGAMRMPEIEGFQQAFPNVANWGGANNGIADRLQDDALTAANKLKFIDGYIRGGLGTFADANAAWEQQQQLPAVPPPMQMVPDANSPIGSVPAPGVAPPQNPTGQQAAILNWSADKGFH